MCGWGQVFQQQKPRNFRDLLTMTRSVNLLQITRQPAITRSNAVKPRILRFVPLLVLQALIGMPACTGTQTEKPAGETPDSNAPVRPMVASRHENGQPAVVAYVRGETRVRDEHYAPTGEKIAEVNYELGGHRGAWKQFYLTGETQAAYYVVDGKKKGEEWRFDQDGHRIAIVPYKDGVRDGVQFEFLPTGEKRTELRWKNGEPDGPLTTFYTSGERESVVNVVNERKHGVEVQYHKNGQLKAEVPYHFGIMDGLATYYDDKGQKLASVPYKQGVPDGEETRYYPSGRLKMKLPLVQGERHGMATLYNTEEIKEAEIPFVHGHVEGFDRRFNTLGRLHMAVLYHDDAPSTIIREFYPSNYLEVERLYDDVTELNGKEIRYYEPLPGDPTVTVVDPEHPVRGKKWMEIPLSGDKKNGQGVMFDRAGHKISVVTFVDDERHGIEMRYHPPEVSEKAAQKAAEFHWDHERPVGMAQTWWPNGHRQSEFPYQDGHGSGIETRYDINGKLHFTVPLVQGLKQGKATLYDPKTQKVTATLQYKEDLQDGDETRFNAKGKSTIIYVWKKGHLVSAMTPKRKKLDLFKIMTTDELEALEKDAVLGNPAETLARAKAWQQKKKEDQEREALAAGAMAIRAGTIETYFRDSPTQVQSRFPASGTGMEVQYHKNGQVRMTAPLVNGQRNGLARIYDETGTLWAMVPFVNGSKQGVEKRFARTGERIAEYPYKADQPTGIARTWFSDGSKQSEYNFEPVGRGTEVQFHRNGEVRQRVTLVDGKRQGLAVIYTETGVKWAEVPYLAGLRHGTEVRFDSEGHRMREIVWRMGAQVSDKAVSGP